VAGDVAKGAMCLKFLQELVESEGFKYLLELGSVKTILDREVRKRRQGIIFLNASS